MSLKTITPAGSVTINSEPGVYALQLNQTLTGSEEIAVTGGGQTFHTFDLASIDDLSGITLTVALPAFVLTASGNSGDLEIGVERIQSL